MSPTPSFERTCPRCRAPVPVHDHFRSWCDRCEWNLEEDVFDSSPTGLFNRIWIWANRRFGEGQFERAVRDTSLRPKVSFLAMLAIILSLVVHLITLALVVVLFGLVVQGVIDIQGGQMPLVWLYKFFLAILLFFVLQKIRPRLGKLPKGALRQENAPVLFSILNRVSKAMRTRTVRAVILTPEYNSGIQSVGLRQELTLFLGLPFLFSLDRYELVALLSHELAHDVNGDPVQQLLIGNAVHSLSEWFDLFFVEKFYTPENAGFAAMIALAIQILVWILSSLFWLLTGLLSLLLFPLMQRAEYYADGSAVFVAGQKAAERLLYKSQLRDAFHQLMQRAAEFPGETPIFDTIQQFFPDPPEREFERIRRVISKGHGALVPSHPSPKQRLAYMRSRLPVPGQVAVSDAEFRKMIEELAPYAARIEGMIKQALRA